jgi:protoheme IX farnesyltransferase
MDRRGTRASQAIVGAEPASGVRGWIGVYKELSKPTLSSLVVGSTSAGYLLAGGPVSASALAAACVGTSLQAWSANTFNQVWETKNDALMNRTKGRPMPTGRISAAHALAWGAASGSAGTAVLLAGCNPTTAALGALNIGLYALVYTPMKTRTRWNTWAGAVVGALPPVMGWTAAGGALLAPEPALIGATLFLWQFPHFFSLAWRSRLDYKAGGYKMVPVLDRTGAWTASLIQRYIAYLTPLPILASYAGLTSSMFAVESLAFNGYWLWMAHKFKQKRSNRGAQRVFRASLWYLPVVMTLMVYHSRNWAETTEEERDTRDAARTSEGADWLGRFADPAMRAVRRQFSALCPHEWVAGDADALEKAAPAAKAFCPPIAASTVPERLPADASERQTAERIERAR